jgi:hypothetical protein
MFIPKNRYNPKVKFKTRMTRAVISRKRYHPLSLDEMFNGMN